MSAIKISSLHGNKLWIKLKFCVERGHATLMLWTCDISKNIKKTLKMLKIVKIIFSWISLLTYNRRNRTTNTTMTFTFSWLSSLKSLENDEKWNFSPQISYSRTRRSSVLDFLGKQSRKWNPRPSLVFRISLIDSWKRTSRLIILKEECENWSLGMVNSCTFLAPEAFYPKINDKATHKKWEFNQSFCFFKSAQM